MSVTIVHSIGLVSFLILVSIVFTKLRQQRYESNGRLVLVMLLSMIAYYVTIPYVEMDLPIVPLGFLGVYLWARHQKRWHIDRPFALLGISIMPLLSICFSFMSLVSAWLYPADELSTYIDNTQFVSVYEYEGEGRDYILQQPLEPILQQFTLQRTTAAQPVDLSQYAVHLMHVKPKLGSLLEPHIVATVDGKQVIVMLEDVQYYFESEQSIFK